MKTMIMKIGIVFFLFISFFFIQVPTMTKKKVYYKHIKKDEYVHVKIDQDTQNILLDDYLLGVVAGEMPASFHEEAIKAQVLASRTFVYSRLLSVDNTTSSQVYLTDQQIQVSWKEHYHEYKEKVKKAIKDTKGEIITYQGKCISALFYSSSNGYSENVEDYFKGSPQPYLKSVDSHWDKNEDPRFKRKNYFTVQELKTKLHSLDFKNITYKKSGRVDQIQIGNKIYTGREVREILNLPSSDFKIIKEGNKYCFITQGCGHGVGMSQYGAQGMAKEGYDYKAIIQHYYQGVKIEKR